MDTIGSLLDRLQGLFSKGFLLVGFIPAFLFVLLNTVFAYWVFPNLHDYFDIGIRLFSQNLYVAILFLVLLIFIIGVSLWSLNPVFRQVLEGRYLIPSNWRDRMTK